MINRMAGTLPPGPTLPRALQTALIWRRPVAFLDFCRRRYGDVFTVYAAPMGHLVYLADPTDIRTVFGTDPMTARAGEANSVMRGLLGGSSLLLLDGDRHRDRRRLMLPPFHRDAVRRQGALMAEVAAMEVDRWPVGRPFAVAPRMSAITLEVILRTVLGADDEHRLGALRRALPPLLRPGVLATLAMARPALLRRRPWAGLRRLRAEADRLLYAEIRDRRTDPDLAARTDVLAMLVAAAAGTHSPGDGRHMTDDELRDQLVTLLFAGHETTATGLAWTCERLVRHPDLLRRAVTAADDGDDAYLDAVVRESLRCRPVVFDVARTLTEPVAVGGHLLPAGVLAMPAIGLLQRSAEHHDDPERFDPDRPAGPWIPFGGGTRRCLGATFAQVEMRIVLREMLRRVDLATTTARAERPRVRHVTLVPHRGGRITVAARRTTVAHERDDRAGARIEA